MANWIMLNKGADFNEISKFCGISPVTARLIRNRGVIGKEETAVYISATTADLDDPLQIPGMADAVQILIQAIGNGKKIRIIGDYDVDGICSTYILHRLITFLGGFADYELPDRMLDGYGINDRLVDDAINDGIEMIITCDNGIAAASTLQKAKDAGMIVVVTDHHEIPFREIDGRKEFIYPPADAIVEPKICDPDTNETICAFPNICGAAVTFKLAQVMLGSPDITGNGADDDEPQKALREMLCFCAIATICDVMPLIKENRIFVKYGLKEAARTANTGLRALIMASGLYGKDITGYHAGFVLGPCLNASGRLDSAKRSLMLFEEQDPDRAMEIAAELKALNDSRKSMTEKGVLEAVRLVEENYLQDKVLVVKVDTLHESLAGIAAGRLRERYERPVFVITPAAGEDGIVKGSGRSIDSYDMYAEMNKVSDLFTKFGGHKSAAGFSLRAENVELLRERLNKACTLTEKEMATVMYIDMELPLKYMSADFVSEFVLLEPTGQSNRAPLFVSRNITLQYTGAIGKNRNLLKFKGIDEEGRIFDMKMFGHEEDYPELTGRADRKGVLCHVVFCPEINEWKGRTSLQFIIKDWRVINP